MQHAFEDFIADDIDVTELALSLGEELKSRAPEFEKQGFVSQDLVDRLASMGLYRLCTPKNFAGLGRPPSDYARLVETLAMSDSATAWVTFIGITSALSMTNLEKQTALELLSSSLAITAGVFAPMARATHCEFDGVKGFRVTGQWQWGSGSRNAEYISGGGFVVDGQGEIIKLESGAPDQRSFFMPLTDVTLLDTWHVSGLKGTGSTDFRVDDLFVPESMTFNSHRQGGPVGPIHSFPTFAFLGIGIGAVALGMARASLDEFIKLASVKTPQGSSKPLAMKPATHSKIAVAEAKLRSARLFFYDAIETGWQQASTTGEPTVEARRDIRLATTHGVQTAVEVIDSIYTLAGGSSVYETSPLQRNFRDVHVATQHMMVNEATLELVGRLFVGVDTNVNQL